MKAYIKRVVPQPFIVGLKVAFRYVRHISDGSFFKWVNLKNTMLETDFPSQLIEKQEIKQGVLFENKRHNIQLTASKISGIVIPLGAIFSFWHLVGNPSQRNGYRKSRMIRNGEVDFEIGGGICQVSSIVYLAALRAGLTVLERHNHSVDIYQEHERIAPLGADATVVYGTKDFQFMNNSDGDIQLIFNVLEKEITLTILSKTPIKERFLHFGRQELGSQRIVKTIIERQGKKEVLSVSVYKVQK